MSAWDGNWIAVNGAVIHEPTQNIIALVSYQNQEISETMAASKELLECTELFYQFLTGKTENNNFEEMCKNALSKAGFPIVEPTQSDDDWDNLPF